MFSSQFNFLYLHVPKTGGNSIQTLLLPFSDDQKLKAAHQDGTDRFGVSGPLTVRKHATLQDYVDRMPNGLGSCQVVISVRHPFERALSNYFSPHRWFRKTGPDTYEQGDGVWDEANFWHQLEQAAFAPITSYLRLDNTVFKPQFVIRYERLQQDFNDTAKQLGLPASVSWNLPHVNRSVAPNGIKEKLLQDNALRDCVEKFYIEDMVAFEYGPYRHQGT